MNAEDLQQLPTADLQRRAFALARQRRDWRFFIDLFRHTPAASGTDLDPDVAEIGVAIDDLVSMWREATEGMWGEAEPLARARFIDYLAAHESDGNGDEENGSWLPAGYPRFSLIHQRTSLANSHHSDRTAANTHGATM